MRTDGVKSRGMRTLGLNRLAAGLGAALAVALPLSMTAVGPGIADDESPAPAATSGGDQYYKIDDATFKWSVNDESTGGSYFGGCNFLVAGKAGDAGSSRVWSAADADKLIEGGSTGALKDGNVSIHKSDGKAGTFANKCKTACGTSVNGKVNAQADDNHTGDYVQIAGGEGTIDPRTDTGVIQWKGSFTFVYYGGMTYWTITDPKMIIENGRGRFTGTYSGVGADMDDPSVWISDLTKQKDYDKKLLVNGTIIDLQNRAFDLDPDFKSGDIVTDDGKRVEAKATPDFLGVGTTRDGRNPQAEKTDTNKSWWGSMPDAWVAFNQLTNQDSYWYTTDGGEKTVQPRKKTNPLTIDYTVNDLTAEPPDPDGVEDPNEPPPSNTPKPTPSSPDDDGGDNPTGGSGATMYWGLNKESSSGAFYGGCNFLVAGTSGDNGRAAVWTNKKKLFKAKSGNVTSEKPNKSGTYKPITWANKCLDRDGQKVSTGRKGSHTEDRVKIVKGSYDDADGITVKWKGSFTIAFYGGMTYWTISDPTLKVDAKGNGTMTGTASGFGADMDNLDKWDRLPTKKITMLNFSGLDVAKAKSDGGFTVTPAYEGVKVDGSGGRNDQDRSAGGWGSFPTSWISYNILTGQSSYWYHSGGARDAYKKAAPLTVALKDGFIPDDEGYDASPDGGNGTTASNSGGPGGNGGDSANGAKNSGGPAGADDADLSQDHTAFRAVAAEAQSAGKIGPFTPGQWAGGAGAVGGTAALTLSAGWWLRRRIGLDPAQWL